MSCKHILKVAKSKDWHIDSYSFDITTFLDLEIALFYRKIPLWLERRFSCASKLKAI